MKYEETFKQQMVVIEAMVEKPKRRRKRTATFMLSFT